MTPLRTRGTYCTFCTTEWFRKDIGKWKKNSVFLFVNVWSAISPWTTSDSCMTYSEDILYQAQAKPEPQTVLYKSPVSSQSENRPIQKAWVTLFNSMSSTDSWASQVKGWPFYKKSTRQNGSGWIKAYWTCKYWRYMWVWLYCSVRPKESCGLDYVCLPWCCTK